MYHQFITMEFVLGATIPVLFFTSLLYKIIWGYTKEWKSCKKYPTAS